MISEKIEETTYLGSCADDKYGIGNMIRGKGYKKTSEGFEMECLDGEWIKVYCVVVLTPNLDNDEGYYHGEPIATTTITWVEG